jgi:hypothetical protein
MRRCAGFLIHTPDGLLAIPHIHDLFTNCNAMTDDWLFTRTVFDFADLVVGSATPSLLACPGTNEGGQKQEPLTLVHAFRPQVPQICA